MDGELDLDVDGPGALDLLDALARLRLAAVRCGAVVRLHASGDLEHLVRSAGFPPLDES